MTSAASPIPSTCRRRPSTGAAVVATHILGWLPGWPTPTRSTTTCVAEVADFLVQRAERARLAAGAARAHCARRRIGPGQVHGGPVPQLCSRASPTLAGLGYPLLLSASNKTFLGVTLDLAITERRDASLAAAALGTALGLPHPAWVHDVKGDPLASADAMAAVSAAR